MLVVAEMKDEGFQKSIKKKNKQRGGGGKYVLGKKSLYSSTAHKQGFVHSAPWCP